MPRIEESLSAAQRASIRRRSEPRDSDGETGELNVVPFLDILLNVLMFVLATNVSAGCDALGPGLAIEKKDGDYDYASLNRCVAKIQSKSTDFADEHGVTLTASPAIPYRALVAAMDAERKREDGATLYDDVRLGIVR